MIKYTLYIFLLLTIFSCGEDFFSTSIEIEIPKQEPKLVLHLTSSTVVDSTVALLTKTVDLDLDPIGNVSMIPGAEISIESSEGETRTFTDVNGLWYTHNYELKEEGFFKPGVNYTIKVEKDGFETVSASQTIPDAAIVTEAKYSYDGGLNIEGDEMSSVDIVLHDKAGEENYYEVTLYQIFDLGGEFSHATNLESTDPSVQPSIDYTSVLITDKLFDGETKKIKLLTYQHQDPEVHYELAWSSITKDQYEFSKSARKADEEEDNPFSTPVQIYSNIENGLGIFALSNTINIEVEM